MGGRHLRQAGLEKEKAALLVVLGALRDRRKVALAVESGHRESTGSWSGVLPDLKRRWLADPAVVVGDGNLGIWSVFFYTQLLARFHERHCQLRG